MKFCRIWKSRAQTSRKFVGICSAFSGSGFLLSWFGIFLYPGTLEIFKISVIGLTFYAFYYFYLLTKWRLKVTFIFWRITVGFSFFTFIFKRVNFIREFFYILFRGIWAQISNEAKVFKLSSWLSSWRQLFMKVSLKVIQVRKSRKKAEFDFPSKFEDLFI